MAVSTLNIFFFDTLLIKSQQNSVDYNCTTKATFSRFNPCFFENPRNFGIGKKQFHLGPVKGVLQYVAVSCIVLQCVAVRCNVLQHAAVQWVHLGPFPSIGWLRLEGSSK